MAIVTSRKTVSFNSPYTGATFQHQTELMFGRDGYISGGAASDDGATITVQTFVMVQRGIIAESLAVLTGLAVPTGAEPWFLMAALADDHPDSGIVVTVTTSLEQAVAGVVIASKLNGVWHNPLPVDVKGAAERAAAEPGAEDGFRASATLDGSDNVATVAVHTGQLVDPDGVRRRISALEGESALALEMTPYTPSVHGDRIDYAVLRQQEDFSAEVITLLGGSRDLPFGGVADFTAPASTRAAYASKKGGAIGEQWYAWGEGNELHVQGGPAGEGFADAAVHTGGAAINWCWVVGQRASDDAVVILFSEGDAIRMISVAGATGVVVNAATNVSTQANTCQHVRAVMDRNERVHVVYEHDEGTEQQIYYTRVIGGTTDFASHDITPRIVAGANTGSNDTWPSIAIDRLGNTHVVYTAGSGTNEFGSFVYAVIDSDGELDSLTTHLPATAAGGQAAYDDDIGFVARAYDSFHRARVAVTPHGDVYAVMLGAPTATGTVDDLMLFSPGFSERLRFPIIRAMIGTFDGIGESCDIVATDAGEIRLTALVTAGGNDSDIWLVSFDTTVAPNGRLGLGEHVGFIKNAIAGAVDAQSDDMIAAISPHGDLVVMYSVAGSAFSIKAYMYLTTTNHRGEPTPHPKDVYLAGWRVPSNASGDIPTGGGEFKLFSARPKRLNHPFLVGDGGRYTGFTGIYDAIQAAAKSGGEVIVRPGRYNYDDPYPDIHIPAGVSLIGEGRVSLDNINITAGASLSAAIASIAGNIVESASDYSARTVRPGDFIEITGGGTPSGLHRVLERLPAKAGLPTRLLVEDGLGAVAPSGTDFQIYRTGTKICNLNLRGSISVTRLWQGYISDLALFGPQPNGFFAGINLTDCMYTLVERIDGTGIEQAGGGSTVRLLGGSHNMLRSVRVKDGEAGIAITPSAQHVSLVDVAGDGSDPAAVVFDITSGRTTPVHMIGCAGQVGAGDDQDLVTGVGRIIRAPKDAVNGYALAFEDGNTRAAAGLADDLIHLTAGAHQEFNGATPGIIVGSVNERVLKAGDVMTGALSGPSFSGDVIETAEDGARHADAELHLALPPSYSSGGNEGGGPPHFSFTAAGTLQLQIPLHVGRRIKKVRAWIREPISAPAFLEVWKAAMTGSPGANTTQLGATTATPGDGSGLFQYEVDLSGSPESITVNSQFWVQIDAGAAGPEVYLVTVIYDHVS